MMTEDLSRNPDPKYNKLTLGVCPDQWGVWFANDPVQVPWDTALDEMAEAGFSSWKPACSGTSRPTPNR
jgi:inosose dehydratase